jgi:hypothetical protein
MIQRLALTAFITIACLPAQAETLTESFRATVSPAATAVLGQAWQPAWLVGIATKHHVIGPLYWGRAGYGGLSTLGAMGYGGATIGISGRLLDWLSYDASLLFGGAGGSAFGTAGGGIALEPSIGMHFPKVFALSTLRVGYLAVPSSPVAGGLTIGLRLDCIQFSVEVTHPSAPK